MYLGFHDYTQTKLDIVFLLDESKIPLTTKEIHKEIGHSNIETIKKIMKELQEDLLEVYPNNEVELSISKRSGITLTRDATNLQKFVKYALTNDLTYKIYIATIFNNSTETLEFVEENFISRSSIRRRIQEMNEYLIKMDLHISFGKVMKINGPEYSRRIMAYRLMSIIKLELEELPIKGNTDIFYSLAENVAKYLDISKEKHLSKIAAIIYITHAAKANSSELELSGPINEAMRALTFPAKPRILTFFNDDDWELMVLLLSSLNLDGIALDLNYKNISVPKITELSNKFVGSFEASFNFNLSPEQVELVHKLNHKFYIKNLLYPLENDGLNTFPTIRPITIRNNFPAYFKHFTNFFAHLKDLDDSIITTSSLYEFHAFFICAAILPLESSFPNIKFYIEADLDELILMHIKNRLAISLSGKCKVSFSDYVDDAHIILKTASTRHIEPTKTQTIIEILPTLSVTDLDKVHSVVRVLTYKMVDDIKGV